jgi:hypothetical protein
MKFSKICYFAFKISILKAQEFKIAPSNLNFLLEKLVFLSKISNLANICCTGTGTGNVRIWAVLVLVLIGKFWFYPIHILGLEEIAWYHFQPHVNFYLHYPTLIQVFPIISGNFPGNILRKKYSILSIFLQIATISGLQQTPINWQR